MGVSGHPHQATARKEKGALFFCRLLSERERLFISRCICEEGSEPLLDSCRKSPDTMISFHTSLLCDADNILPFYDHREEIILTSVERNEKKNKTKPVLC